MRNDALFNYSKNSYSNFLCLIDNKKYIFRATLVNPDNNVVELQKSAIRELVLQDNIFNPFFEGHIVIDNSQNAIERFISVPESTEFLSYSDVIKGYRVRGDARDILLLSITPVIGGNDYDTSTEKFNHEFGLRYVFCLANEVDLADDANSLKRYDIRDFDCEILKEKKIFFSTARYQKKDKISFLSNLEREMETGNALKQILKTGLNDSTSIFTVLSGGQEITPNFESGSSKIFYSSPNNFTGYDDLMYIYSYHVSNSPAKDFSFLKKDNYTGEYTLRSASNYFEKAYNKTNDSGGEFFLENLTIAGGQNSNNVIVNDIKKPLVALEFGEVSDIKEVKFFNPSGSLYQDKIRSILVHSYDFTEKRFFINCVDGNVQNVKQDFYKLYVDKMKGKNDNPTPNLTLNNTQKTNINYDNQYMVYVDDTDFIQLSVGRNQLLKNAIICNLGVEITVSGGLHRQSGRFISIDRTGNYVDNDFDKKFLGIYFILNVTHTFIDDNQFLNKIVAVKTYLFDNFKYNENIS